MKSPWEGPCCPHLTLGGGACARCPHLLLPPSRISEQELYPVSARARVFIELPLSITG